MEKTFSRDLAYILGFFAADGNLTKNKNGSCYVEFTSTDLDLINSIKEKLGVTNKITIRKGTATWKDRYRLQIGSKELYHWLIKIGFSRRKSDRLAFPSVPMKVISDFIRGYFDGDGCVMFNLQRKKPYAIVRFTSKSKKFLESLARILSENFDLSYRKIYFDSKAWRLSYSKTDSIKLFSIMYSNIKNQIFLKRKFDKYKALIQSVSDLKGVVV